MKPRRFTFADDHRAAPVPAAVWITRSTLTGLIAGLGCVAYLYGYFPF